MDVLFARLHQSDSSNIKLLTEIGYQLAEQIDGSIDHTLKSIEVDKSTTDNLVVMGRDELSLPADLQQQLDSGQVLTLESEAGVVLYYFLRESNQVLAINWPASLHTRTGLRLLLTVIFYLAIVGFILLWLSPLVRRLQSLAVVAKKFGEGDLQSRISTHPRSNLHDIEVEFNRMAQRIQDLLDDNRMLTSAVSHDLRTPLSRLRFGVDALAEQTTDPLQNDYLDRLSTDLSAMEQLVEVLLEFARLEQRLNDIPLRSVQLAPVLMQITERVGQSSDCEIELLMPSTDVHVLGDERYINMLVNNLLQNAIRFARQAVRVSVVQSNQTLCVYVEDDGPGLQSTDRDRLLKPFERGSDSVNKVSKPNYGLGLAIVQRIADWHGGQVQLGDSESLGGACISVQFMQPD